MHLRFSSDDGVTYYNKEDPRITVTSDESSPHRKLASQPNLCGSCPALEDFYFQDYLYREPFQACFQYRDDEDKYCWTNSHINTDTWDYEKIHFLCYPLQEEGCGPLCLKWKGNKWKFALRMEESKDGHLVAGSCGEPCPHTYKPPVAPLTSIAKPFP